MPYSPEEIEPALDRLLARMDELEKRLSALERRGATAPAAQRLVPDSVAPHPVEQLSLARSAGAMPTVGKVFLGMAGAYLLRAGAQSAVLPKFAIVPIAMAHAGMWLIWAARAHSRSTFSSGAYAVTASLILSPMLWELTTDPGFQAIGLALPPVVAAAVLVAFVLGASILAWKDRLISVVWAPMAAASATSLALMIATRDPAPFVLALFSIAVLAETAAEAGRWPLLRMIPALAADAAALVLILVYTRAGGAPPEYRPASAGVLLALFAALFVIAALATLSQTVFLRRPIRYFDVTQTVLSFVIASVGVLRAGHESAATGLGIFCLAAAAGCYMLAFARFDGPANVREYHVFGAWAAALLVMGSVLSFSPEAQTTWLGLAALGALVGSVRTERLTLAYDALIFLFSAVLASGALHYAGSLLAGSIPSAPRAMVWVAVAAVLLCYALAWRLAGDTWPRQAARMAFAALTVFVGTALLVALITRLAPAAFVLAPPVLAAVRTLVICMAALASAFAGARSQRAELVWLAYTIMALCTLKLGLEDLRAGSAVSLAFSLFFYGMAWVLAPRLARAGKKA
ncbi:MAG TPA: hypothetical protein VF532_23150 [Candidatus Angelobacter sp.]